MSVLGSLVLVVLLACFVVASNIAERVTPRASGADTTQLTTQLLSVRRAPTVLANETRTSKVLVGLRGVTPELPTKSCLTVSWLGRQLVSSNASTPYVPGSVVKLFTANAALKVLGESYTFSTEARGVVEDGAVQGDLVLVGGGDPLLVRRDYLAKEKYPTSTPTYLETLADSIVNAGVRSVTGSIVVDDSRYDSERYVATWAPEIRGTEGGPLGALVVSDGAVIGEMVKPENPAISAGRDLRTLLRLRGVVVSDSVVMSTSKTNVPVIASVASAPLTSIVTEMLVNSDNNTAELLTKEMSYFERTGGSTAEGVKVIVSAATKDGVPMDGVTIVDGSGLSRENTLTCAALQALLLANGDVLSPLMAVAGETGTLASTFTSHSIKGKMRAKTGSLSGVKSLAGYVSLSGVDAPTFVLLMNRDGIQNQKSYKPIWYDLADALDRAKSSPTVEEIAP